MPIFQRTSIFYIFFTVLLFLGISSIPKKISKPSVCISFDDGNSKGILSYSNEDWNNLILSHLSKNNIQAIFYVWAGGMDNSRGQEIINEWSSKGHLIGNHSYSHLNYNKEEITFEIYRDDFLKCDSLIKNNNNFVKYYRFPYLKEGNTAEKRDLFREILKNNNYKTGHVTIDASDWYIDSRLISKLKENKNFELEKFKSYYVNHIIDRAKYYNSLGVALTDRNIQHTLLLHHNLVNALFLTDIIKAFKQNGWEVIDAEKSFSDPIYREVPSVVPAGESLLWALAKEKGRYDSILRYPAESAQYEKQAMDSLGL